MFESPPGLQTLSAGAAAPHRHRALAGPTISMVEHGLGLWVGSMTVLFGIGVRMLTQWVICVSLMCLFVVAAIAAISRSGVVACVVVAAEIAAAHAADRVNVVVA